jgi:hypothetical protein
LHYGFATSFGQGVQEEAAIPPAPKNGFTAIPSVHHMVDRSGKFTAHLSRHGPTLPQRPKEVNQFKK